MDASTLFNAWLAERSASNYDPLSAKAAKPYMAIWTSWVHWLARIDAPGLAPKTYLEATAVDIASFLVNGPSPRSSRRAELPLSEITRRRYWSVLDAVYGHAVCLGLIAQNPAAGLIGNDMPPPEKPIGQVFTAAQMNALIETLPEGPNLWKLRDRAMLDMLIYEALSVAELCAMSVADLTPSLVDKGHFILSIEGKRKAQERQLNLGSEASTSLADWLAACPARSLDEQCPVFITERLRRISPRVVFHLVATTISKAFAAKNLALPKHIGPQVLRNTRIVYWVNKGVNLDVVMLRAGLKDQQSLRGLRDQISDSVSSHLSGRS
jgi:site-specific recombinase XerD